MIRSLMKNMKLYLVTCIFLGVVLYAQAKPMDTEAGRELPNIEKILVSVCTSGRLDSDERKDIVAYLSSSNGVIVSLGAWITAQSKDCNSAGIGRINENGKIVPKVSQPRQSKETADLESYFKEVCISSSNVVMRFHDQGMRYIMINDEESKVSRYGESICLSTNQSMRIVSRGRSLELKGYSNEKDAGFVVTSKIDLRSLGGGLKVKKARWIISSKKLEIDNDKGLFVVSSPKDCTRETGCD